MNFSDEIDKESVYGVLSFVEIHTSRSKFINRLQYSIQGFILIFVIVAINAFLIYASNLITSFLINL